MLSVRDMAGVAAGKLAFKLARRRGSSGSVMPGHVAQKISPHLLETLAQDVEVYLVTGTNGKGSTIAFLSVADNLGQERCICNVLHSNMLNGMVTSFVMESGAFEKSPKKIAFLECDVSSPAGSRTYRVAYGQSAVLYNVLAAHVLWRVVGGDPDELAMGIVAHSLKEARRHTTVVRGCTVHREMVKNAIGANVAIDRFVDSDVQATLLLGLGRKVVDSSDPSWIWNVEFERLAACEQRIPRIYVLGTASNALIARLVCAGIPRGKIVPLEQPNEVRAVCEQERELYSFCSGSVTPAVARVVARMREEER